MWKINNKSSMHAFMFCTVNIHKIHKLIQVQLLSINLIENNLYIVHIISLIGSLCCRDVSSAGLVIANHQDIKSEIETRADSFTACSEMGRTLINNNHYASDEVYPSKIYTHTYSVIIKDCLRAHTCRLCAK